MTAHSDFADFPYSGERRPFDWFMEEPPLETQPSAYLYTEDTQDATADLILCMSAYLTNRRACYINYMGAGKCLFKIFFPTALSYFRQTCPYWQKGMTEFINQGNPSLWSGSYEIQRLWIVTGIHWSWLEWAWIKVQDALINEQDHWALDELYGSHPHLGKSQRLITWIRSTFNLMDMSQ